MSLPDLSFLHQAQASRDLGQEVPGPSSPPPQPERRSPLRPEGPLAELISELRSYQAELADALMRGISRYFAKNPPLARSRSV